VRVGEPVRRESGAVTDRTAFIVRVSTASQVLHGTLLRGREIADRKTKYFKFLPFCLYFSVMALVVAVAGKNIFSE
jgi:hypothetical protein